MQARSRLSRGSVVLTSLLVLLLMSVGGLALLSLAMQNSRLCNRRALGLEALSLAQGGLDITVARLRTDKNYTGIAGLRLGSGVVDVRISTPTHHGLRQVTSSARVSDGTQVVTKSVRATVGLVAFPPLFGKALVGAEILRLEGNTRVDSRPLESRGDVHSNGVLEMIGSGVQVNGRATASHRLLNGGATVSSEQKEGVPPLVFPRIDEDQEALARLAGRGQPSDPGNSGTTRLNGPAKVLRGKIDGDVVVGEDGCTVVGAVWITGRLRVEGPLHGTGSIVSEKEITIHLNQSPGQAPSGLVALMTPSMSDAGAVRITGEKTVRALIYAPNGTAYLAGGTHLVGGIMAKRLYVGGPEGPTRVEKVTSSQSVTLPLPGYLERLFWEEGPFD